MVPVNLLTLTPLPFKRAGNVVASRAEYNQTVPAPSIGSTEPAGPMHDTDNLTPDQQLAKRFVQCRFMDGWRPRSLYASAAPPGRRPDRRQQALRPAVGTRSG